MPRTIAFLALLALAVLPLRASAQGAGYSLIVNRANPVSSLSAKEVSDFFLKKTTRWSNDSQIVLAVDLPEGSPARLAFTGAIHGKSVPAIKAYWQQQIFSGRSVPPPERASELEVVAYVTANPYAIGYVSATTTDPGVKVVTVTGGGD